MPHTISHQPRALDDGLLAKETVNPFLPPPSTCLPAHYASFVPSFLHVDKEGKDIIATVMKMKNKNLLGLQPLVSEPNQLQLVSFRTFLV
jgi:hypothetical protein